MARLAPFRVKLWDIDTSDRGRGSQVALIDDATSRLFCRFFPRDTGAANRQLLVGYLARYGRMGAVYADRAGHFQANFRRTERQVLAFCVKVGFFLVLYVWVRWTLPRFRYDQLMALGWKVFIPMGLAYILFVAVAVWVVDGPLGVTSPAARSGLLFLFNVPVLVLVFRVLDRGRLISGASMHRPEPASRPARAA